MFFFYLKWTCCPCLWAKPGWDTPSPAPSPPLLLLLPPSAASVSCLPLYVQTARPSQEEAVHATIVARAINTLAPRGVKFPCRAGEQEATTWGIPAFIVPGGTVKQDKEGHMLINTGQIRFVHDCRSWKVQNRRRKVWLMLTDGPPKKQDVATMVAQLRQRDGCNGFLPLANLFCSVLTFPQTPPSSVLLTMPGSSRDLHLPLCFLNPCFLSCFLFFMHNWSGLHANKKEHKGTHTSTTPNNKQSTSDSYFWEKEGFP